MNCASHHRPVFRSIKPSCQLENLERRQLLSASGVRSIDGTGNNLAHPGWGATDQPLIRLAAPAYADGLSAPAGADRPSARAISDGIAAHAEGDEPSANHLSAFDYVWGQFIDHDLDLTSAGTDPLNIAVPAGDPWFDPSGTGTEVIDFNRSNFETGTGTTNARQQPNEITAFIDGSMIYGSDATRAAALRTFKGGMLKTSAGDMLPFNTGGLPNANDAHIFPDNQLFLAGDLRANENIELTAMQTLLMREHNRLAGIIARSDRSLSDEQIYQRARKLVIAEVQMITYNEFLPALLGQNAIPSYRGYNPKVNPGISTEFSTAAFRLGHSMLEDDVEFFDNNGEEVRDEMPLSQAFFNPAAVSESGIDPILKYLASTNSEEIDNQIVDSLRNFLFGPPGAGGFDLASLNIQRGRDHGLADYNTIRAALGLPRITDFSQITSNQTVQQELKSLYGSVNDMDLWVAGLAEDHVRGSNVGPTFQRILVDQFTRLRNGDRFWYQNYLNRSDMRLVGGTTLEDVIERNSGVNNLQPDVFHFDVVISGKVWNDRDGDGRIDRGEHGLAGREVSVIDEAGDVTQTIKTDADGRYTFHSVGLGQYQIMLDVDNGWRLTKPEPAPVDATRGMSLGNVNFGVQRVPAAAAPASSSLSVATGESLASDVLA